MNFLCFSLLGIFLMKTQDARLVERDNIEATARGGRRWSFPLECKDGCRYIEWIPFTVDTDEWIQFTIRGISAGYIGMAISEDTRMGNDDAYLCSATYPGSSDVKISSAHLIGFTNPVIEAMVPSQDIVDTFIYDDIMTCVFNRRINVTKTVSGLPITWDISNDKFNLLYAEGVIDAPGNIQYHRYRTHTHDGFHLLGNATFQQHSELARESHNNYTPPLTTSGKYEVETTTTQYEIQVMSLGRKVVAIVISFSAAMGLVIFVVYKRM